MMTPEILARVMEATWPPAHRHGVGPFVVRDGQGGGKRVSAATLHGEWAGLDLAQAEAAMDGLSQDRLFMIAEGQNDLDQALAAQGYEVIDPVVAYATPAADLARITPPLATFTHWPPLAVTAEIWAKGGIGPARIAVMARTAGPRTAILARSDDQCSGACFVAMSGNVAMLHALEVLPTFRRMGAARNMLHAAANWAQDQGADLLSLVVTRGNVPARALYASLGMQVVGQYHYRQKQAEKAASG